MAMTGSGSAGAAHADSQDAAVREMSLGPLAADGPFALYPGPMLVVARGGAVLSSNPAAEPIARLLEAGCHGDLEAAVKSALAGRTAQVTPIEVERKGAEGEGVQAFDLVALPWQGGAAALLLGRDITLERSLRSALIDSRQRYKDFVETSSDFAWETDADGCFAFVSPGGALGHAAAQLVGQPVNEFLVEAGGSEPSPFATRMPVDRVEVWFRDVGGAPACLLVTGLPLPGPGGAWQGARGTCRDITVERARETALARAGHRQRLLAYILRMVREELEPARMLAAAVQALVPALAVSGAAIQRRGEAAALVPVTRSGSEPPEGRLDPLLARISNGEPDAELRDDAGYVMVRATGYRAGWNGALCLWRREAAGEWGAEEAMLLDEVSAQIGVALEQLARTAELESLSATDPLTGLLNRRGFVERLTKRLAQPKRRNDAAALLYIDFDNFKLVNDRHGHQAGDRALEGLAEVLRSQVRSGDFAGRLGGDEFALCFAAMSEEAAVRKANQLLDAAGDLEHLSAGPEHPLGLSIGIAIFDPRAPEVPQRLIERADAAMYEVKRNGKGGVRVARAARSRSEP